MRALEARNSADVASLRKFMGQLLAGCLVSISLVYAAKRANALEAQVSVGQSQVTVAHKEQLNDRFSKAVDQVGNAKAMDVRLGGLYALEGVAMEPKDGHSAGLNPAVALRVIAAFVRTKEAPEAPDEETSPRVSPDIEIACEILGRSAEYLYDEHHDLGNAKLPLVKLRYARLAHVKLRDADLSNGDLRGADLNGADLSGADLSGADLSGADLSGADLLGANLREAVLTDATFFCDSGPFNDLRGADLRGADLDGTDFTRADLQKALITRTNLRGANFTLANLSGTYLCKSTFRGAEFGGADLSGADVQGADLRGTVSPRRFDRQWLTWDESTLWPDRTSTTDGSVALSTN